jgi:predicted nuclease of restriction endonuclease-like (RecB) superfamily
MILQKQRGRTWGQEVVQRVSKDLQSAFPGIKGFSASNLWRMKLFHETYARNKKLAPLVREIAWSHNLIVMERCKDDLQREFYIRMTRRFAWSKNVLIHQIENQTYQKTLLSQTSFDETLPHAIRRQAKLAVKDEYTFDFLELAEDHSEKELERAILTKIETFLREMGGMFAFVGSQYRLEVDDEEYFIDLLLYHRTLKSLVAVELKIGKFLPEYVGKMQFYLAVLDDTLRMPDENPSIDTIGIILCKSKNKTIVEYALRESNKPIGVAQYRIVRTLPDQMKGMLPTPEQIEETLREI